MSTCSKLLWSKQRVKCTYIVWNWYLSFDVISITMSNFAPNKVVLVSVPGYQGDGGVNEAHARVTRESTQVNGRWRLRALREVSDSHYRLLALSTHYDEFMSMRELHEVNRSAFLWQSHAETETSACVIFLSHSDSQLTSNLSLNQQL